jgi:tetratricopeptide (TPR) repeat protein
MRSYRRLIGLALATGWLASVLIACDSPPTATPKISAEQHFQQGNGYMQSGQFDKAIPEFEAVLKIQPDQVSALTNLGVAYYNVGRLDDAIAQYQKALAVAPDDADIHSNLAAAYVQKSQLDQALAEYQKAIDLNSTLQQAYFGLGVVYMQLGQNEQALAAFESFLQYDDGTDQLATEQANQYLQQLKGQ